MRGARLLIIGFDGGDWKILRPLLEQNKIPNIAKLIQEGFSSPLNSTTPPMTLPSWSSMLTGATPGVHGIFDFVHKEEDSWKLRFSNAKDRPIPTIHEWLSEQGKRVASIAVPTTWPPSSVNGVIISGFDSPVATGIDGSFCYPKELYQEIEKRFGGLRFADFQESLIGEGWHERALELLHKEIKRKRDVGLWLLEQEYWDCFMLLFGESDTVSHHFWAFYDQDSPRHPKDSPEHLQKAIFDVYIALDEALGKLLASASAEIVCICSDHGFGGAGDYALFLNRYLEQKGWLRYKKQAQVDGLRFGTGILDRVRELGLKYVPHQVQGKIFRKLPSRLINFLESRTRFGNIDFQHTQAVSDEMNYAATIRLNVSKYRERENFERLKQDLLDWEVDGHHPVQEVYFRDDLYQGDCAHRSPEVILILAEREGYTYTLLPSARSMKGKTWRKLEKEELLGGKGLGMNGSHRQHGILLIWGKEIQQGINQHILKEIPNMQDIAVTLLCANNWTIPEHCDGRILQEIFTHSKEERRKTWHSKPQNQQNISSKEHAAIQKRLEGLGYL